jgi:hypothetical protein
MLLHSAYFVMLPVDLEGNLPPGGSRNNGILERISFARTGRAKTLDARLRGHDRQEVIPAKAGIQELYRQLQTALGL